MTQSIHVFHIQHPDLIGSICQLVLEVDSAELIDWHRSSTNGRTRLINETSWLRWLITGVQDPVPIIALLRLVHWRRGRCIIGTSTGWTSFCFRGAMGGWKPSLFHVYTDCATGNRAGGINRCCSVVVMRQKGTGKDVWRRNSLAYRQMIVQPMRWNMKNTNANEESHICSQMLEFRDIIDTWTS